MHAAAGGVGLLLTQMVKMRGGVVIATTSTPQKAELATGAGADHVAGYDDFGAVAREVTGGEGAAVVYDGIGQATFDDSLAALRRRGYMVLYGAASGPVPPAGPAAPGRGRVAVPHPADAGPLHRDPGGAAVPRRRPVPLDRARQADGPHRRPVPARSGRPRPRGPRRPAHHRQAHPAAPVTLILLTR